MGEAFDGKEREQHQNLEHLKVGQLAVGAFHAPKAATVQIDVFKQACKCVHNGTTTRISDGIFVILLMALSFEYVFLLHLIYSFSAIRGYTQSLFYGIISYPFLNPKLE